MKFSEAWLGEWVRSDLTREQLCDRLTMTGLEVESQEPVAQPFSKVVIGEVQTVKPHPAADQLRVCEVSLGKGASLTIVCGASNVRAGMKAALAKVKAVLPNEVHIQETQLRGVTSQGMLCSAAELSLGEEGQGLLELPADAPVGADLWDYLQLSDHLIEVAITPNRGDCLSIQGMAREVAAITASKWKPLSIPKVKASVPDLFPVTIQAEDACPRYVGRVIRGVQPATTTPIWLKEKLRRSGLRSVSPIVDVTNYVMLELGQPMHAFDLARLEKKIVVRRAKEGEELLLLDGSAVQLTTETLIIADQKKPLAIAGVMGGIDSGIASGTQDIFLESAFFTPAVVARQRQLHQLNSESAHRFERGVDPALQRLALERATRLLVDLVGGKPGPVLEITAKKGLPRKTLRLRRERIESILGCSLITDKEVKSLLESLGFECKKGKKQWMVRVPSWRFDVTQEIDLIEELARLYGYHKISPTRPVFPVQTQSFSEGRITLPRVRRLLCDLGYHEAVTYSFVNAELQKLLDPQQEPKPLVNPITADMTVMRTNLWPGLLGTYLYNRDRQQLRGRFFETGLCFVQENKKLLQLPMLGGLLSGSACPEQWGQPVQELDFFDVKADIQNLLQLTHISQDRFIFKPFNHPALHPGQTAMLYREETPLGILGALHPALRQKFDICEPVFLFEFNLDTLLLARPPYFSEISKFPEIRRDLALLVDRHIPTQEIRDTIVRSGGEWLRQVNVFDVYLGEGIPESKKSVAFALILQHATRTLRDEEVAEAVERIVGTLRTTLGIELRG